MPFSLDDVLKLSFALCGLIFSCSVLTSSVPHMFGNRATYVKDEKSNLVLNPLLEMRNELDQSNFEESGVGSRGSLSDSEFSTVYPLPNSLETLSRQFWSAGEYGTKQDHQPVSQGGQNRLRVHPEFLHSNATSHKWAFGAVAELLDNAIDEVQNGATFVCLDKFTNPRDGNPALLIQDDGGGMDPEMLRRCMSFGFSDKHYSSIGQYGNGFKTSTMRLGADVIVFSRCVSRSCALTQSVGLLSYTFLRMKGYDDIIVPMVDYEYNASTGAFERLLRRGQKVFAANLATLLSWSPFSTEEELLNNFHNIGYHGTRVIVFNLWHNDDGILELDFDTDPEDIIINGAHKPVQSNSSSKLLNEHHIAKRLRYSLRVYSSVLYLHTPNNFKIMLRGREVAHHYLAEELEHREGIKYKPVVGGRTEAEVITIVGFLRGAPEVSIHGFNIYHKNRLILPFCPVINLKNSRGRGVSGVLEANFIKPTHDKQAFEKSTLYQKLETRLKEMTIEYWDYHCHLIGYQKTCSRVPAPSPMLPHIERPNSGSVDPLCVNSGGVFSKYNANMSGKRKAENGGLMTEPLKRQVVDGVIEAEFTNPGVQRPSPKALALKEMNKKLLAECLEYEENEKKLLMKAEMLGHELEEYRRWNATIMNELLKLTYSSKEEKR